MAVKYEASRNVPAAVCSKGGGRVRIAGLLLAAASITGCYTMLPSEGGGQTDFELPRKVEPADVALPEGYRIEPIATELTFPTGVTFDAQGIPYVVEAGYSYHDVFTVPRVLRVMPGGRTEVVVEGDNPPWTGVHWHDDAFYVAGGHVQGGRILRISLDGRITALADGLPSQGDHHTNGPVVSADGYLYFGQGIVTNSGVVGTDNHAFGWLERAPRLHDVPCADVRLRGVNYRTPDPIGGREEVETGAFKPFGEPSRPGEVIPGAVPCNGAVLRMPLGGGPLEVVAWGFRNPFGLAFAPDGTLYVTDNGYDNRGSRPVWGAADFLFQVQPGGWYGFPDFSGGVPMHEFKPPREPAPELLLEEHPSEPQRPVVRLGVHSSSNGFDFSRSTDFGFEGDAFIAQFGDMAPGVGKVRAPVGFRVVRVDVEQGIVHGFAENHGRRAGPASLLGNGGLERPVAARFHPRGDALYVVDFGIMLMDEQGARPIPGTGVLWRITRVRQE
jgi:glucose/arabinose dehydrogenase